MSTTPRNFKAKLEIHIEKQKNTFKLFRIVDRCFVNVRTQISRIRWKFFAWKVCADGLGTNLNKHHRHLSVRSKCELCGVEHESSSPRRPKSVTRSLTKKKVCLKMLQEESGAYGPPRPSFFGSTSTSSNPPRLSITTQH